MKANIMGRRPDSEGLADVAVGERSLDSVLGAPDSEMGSAGSAFGLFNCNPAKVRQAFDTREFAQEIAGIAAGMTGGKDPAIPLADRQRGGSVYVGRTSAHGGVAGPGSAKSTDQGS